jgi:CBS domain containing-hemolysin-like protein
MTEEPSVPAPSKPIETPSTGLFERLMMLVGLKHAPSIREDIEDALAEADIGSEFSQRERDMLKNVLGLRANRVQDVMVPRADIVAVSADISLGELLRLFRTAGHSRFPVYHETLDDPRGMIHIRDFVGYVSERAERKLGSRRRKTPADSPDLESLDLSVTLSSVKMLRPVLFVPPSMLALDLLVKMQTTRTHMALVIDEYGGTDGLVSIEDLVEIVVGEIEDEHDLEETPMIQSSDDGTYVVDARADLKDVSAAIGVDLSQGEDAEEIDTIGGLVGMLAGRVPVRGQIIPGPGTLEFEVLDADPRRVKRVRIQQQAVKQKEPVKPKRRSKTQAADAPAESPPDTEKA